MNMRSLLEIYFQWSFVREVNFLLTRMVQFFTGTVEFSAKGPFPERFMNILCRNGINIWNVSRTESGITAETTVRTYKLLRSAAKKTSMRLKVKKRSGFPFTSNRYRHRWGIPIGAVLYIAVIYICSLFVWSVDVINDTSVEDGVILQAAYNSGVKPGMLCSKIECTKSEIEIMEKIPSLSWVSVNTGSTRIKIVVNERITAPEFVGIDEVCNLKALKDGQIVSLDVREGQSLVKAGDTVAAGDLLVSGVIDSLEGRVRTVHAYGTVMANTVTTVSDTVELKDTLRKQTGNKETLKRLVLFGKAIKLYFKDEPKYENDCSTTIQYINLFGARLPIGIETREFTEIEHTEYEYTADMAEEIAKTRLNSREKHALGEAEILDVKEKIKHNENSVTVERTYTCLENIAFEESIDFS